MKIQLSTPLVLCPLDCLLKFSLVLQSFNSKGDYTVIENGCTLYSCYIDEDVLVGAKSVILEGSRVEKGAVIGPNSVVPPGRLIPAG